MASKSLNELEKLLGSVDQLIEIHGKLQQGRGRRYEQEALHRAGVVLAVAAWQAYVEKIFIEALECVADWINASGGASKPPQWAVTGFLMRKTTIERDVKKFNTPNTQNIRRIFEESFSFDPWPTWIWRSGRRSWGSKEFRKRTDDWIKIRHSIAHGFALPENITWIQGPSGQARLTLSSLRECRSHFFYLASITDKEFGKYLSIENSVSLPW